MIFIYLSLFMKLKENNKAPNFKLTSTDGNIFELNKVKKKNIILYFYPKDDNSSFRKLFNYISGQNKNSEKIAMTIPVTQTQKDGEMFMQFYLPSKFNKETTPIPTNPNLEVTIIPEGYFAVLQFSGRSSDKNFDKHHKILKQKLVEDNISINGSAIRATYNSPFTLPPLRRNESMFSIDWKN